MSAALGEICVFNYGEALKEEDRALGTVPVYGSNGIVGWHDRAITQGPTIVIGRKGSIGEVHYSEVPCYPIDTTYFVDRTKVACDMTWLFYMLKALDLTGMNKSAAVPGLNRDDAYREHMPFPPLAEQRRIAAILRAADDERRRRRYTQTLSDGLVGEVFVQMFGDYLGCEKPGSPLGSLVQITGGGTPSRDVPHYFSGSIPWVTAKDMGHLYLSDAEEHVTHQAIDESAARIVPAGTILIVVKSKVLMRRLPLAITTRAMCHNQDIKAIAPVADLDQGFLLYMLKYYESDLLDQARGANTEGLTLDMLNELRIPSVPLDLQRQFADIVTVHEQTRRQQQESARQSDHLFETLLHQAFAGEL